MERAGSLAGEVAGELAGEAAGEGVGRVAAQVLGAVGRQLEKVAEYVPTYAKAYPGFLLADAIPQELNGQRVPWESNAWQIGIFIGFDAAINLGEDALEATTFGGRFKSLITGRYETDPAISSSSSEEAVLGDQVSGDISSDHTVDSGSPEPAQTIPPAADHPADSSPTEPSETIPPAADRPADSSPTEPGDSSPTEPISTTPERGSVTTGGNGRNLINEPGRVPFKWLKFQPKNPRGAFYDGVKEGVNTILGNTVVTAAAARIEHEDVTARDYGITAALSTLAGIRQGLCEGLPFGEKFGYGEDRPDAPAVRRWFPGAAPLEAPAVRRWLSSTPAIWSHYAMYFVVKNAVNNGIYNLPTPTELRIGSPEVSDVRPSHSGPRAPQGRGQGRGDLHHQRTGSARS